MSNMLFTNVERWLSLVALMTGLGSVMWKIYKAVDSLVDATRDNSRAVRNLTRSMRRVEHAVGLEPLESDENNG